MHVLTLTPFYPYAGDDADGCFVSEPLKHVPTFGILSSVWAVRPVYRKKLEPDPQEQHAAWIRFMPVPGNVGLFSSGLFLYARLAGEVRRLHRDRPIDLIHAHGAIPCGHAAALINRSLGIPFVVSVHGLDAFSDQQVKGVMGQWCKRISIAVYRSARRVICVSEHVKQSTVKVMGNHVTTRVVYNGVDPTLFHPNPTPQEKMPIILSVGNLNPIKGHEIVLRAIAKLRDEFPDLRHEIIGVGPEQTKLMKLAQELKIEERIQFLGRRSRQEVADAMRRCTVFALPSRYEGLGCVYLEAMATAKPAIACRGQGIEEIICHQENGWLIEPEDVDDLVKGLLSLLVNVQLRNRLGQEGRRTIISGLTLAHQADRLNEVYRSASHEIPYP